MASFSASDLHAALRAVLPAAARKLCVAYSGGLDSTVLLHALVQHEPRSFELRAIYIDHQLQTASAEWAEHCKRTAESLRVPFVHSRVRVERGTEGLEAAARKARYYALRALLQPEEVVLTAHHADDQLETMLLALMRGAGVRGLSAMPVLQPFGAGWLARPLLGYARSELEDWARAQALRWIDDPTNESVSMDRNYIRHRIVPVLEERWPAAARSAARSAKHLGEASVLIDEVAARDVEQALLKGTLDVGVLRSLSSARRRSLLRSWLRSFGIRAPSTSKLAAIEHDVLAAAGDRSPTIDVDGYQLRRHRDRLYCVPPLPPVSAQSMPWSPSDEIELPAGLGALRFERVGGEGIALAKLPHTLQVRFREGGEVIRLAENRPHRPLKKLLQESDVLPWWRQRLPLVYAGDRLVAVGDSWIDADFLGDGRSECAAIVWRDKPHIYAVR